MKPTRGGLVHAEAGCRDCDFYVGTKNALIDGEIGEITMGLAAQHAERTGHNVWCEIGHHYEWNT